MEYSLLIVEDEKNLRRVVSDYFITRGFHVDTAIHGLEALNYIDHKVYDIIILDIMMPEMDGLEVCKYIRKKYDVPVIFLTALCSEESIVGGYEIGADEYMTKPFSLPVLEAKIRILIKRYHGLMVQNGVMRINEFQIEPSKRMVSVNGRIISLAPKEYDLLLYLIENKNQVLSREQILNRVWGPEFEGYDRAVDTHIKKLRSALGESSYPITTIIKSGYSWKEQLS